MGEPKRTRLIFLGFDGEGVAQSVLGVIESGIKDKAITVEDWAMVHKAAGGELTITKDRGTDPGAARGGLVGGGAGALLAVLSGPIGVGAVAVGAAVGAVTAAVRDSGFKDNDVKEISKQMADGRTGIMVGVPLEAADQWDAFVAGHSEFAAADARHTVDIVPGRTLEDAIDDYRRREDEQYVP
jgi:uncharacterized membrane protein